MASLASASTGATVERKIARVKMKEADNAVALAARVEALNRANDYELRNRSSGHGVAITLNDGTVFWSKGRRACPIGCFNRLDDWSQTLLLSEVRRGGVLVRRWSCVPIKEETYASERY